MGTFASGWEWFSTNLKKWGTIALIAILIKIAGQWLFSWVILPSFLLAGLKQMALLNPQWEWANDLKLWWLIMSWIFVFACLKKVGNTLFEKKNDND